MRALSQWRDQANSKDLSLGSLPAVSYTFLPYLRLSLKLPRDRKWFHNDEEKQKKRRMSSTALDHYIDDDAMKVEDDEYDEDDDVDLGDVKGRCSIDDDMAESFWSFDNAKRQIENS